MKMAEKTKQNEIAIKFMTDNRGDFYETLERVKSLPGRKFHSKSRTWVCPITNENIRSLREWGFKIAPELKEIKKEIEKKRKKRVSDVAIKDDHKTLLYPFQYEGIKMLEYFDGRAVLGDEMGLGKTIQSLVYSEYKEAFPCLIVTTASMKLTWAKEIRKKLRRRDYYIVNGTSENKEMLSRKYNYIIINYDILKYHVEDIVNNLKPKMIITDECHKLQNPSTGRTKSAKEICKNIPYVVQLSGTPITSRPIQFFEVLSMTRPDLFNNRWQYAQKYCGAKHNGFGWDFNGASNLDELHSILVDNLMVRRLKKDVLPELPPKQMTVVPLPINLKEYQDREKEVQDMVAEGEIIYLTIFEKLKQKAVELKIAQVMNWIEDFVESGEKLVVMTTHHFTIDMLHNKFKDISVKHDGRSNQKEKAEAERLFQENPDIKIFFGNMKASGEGLTLTASSNVAFIELGWTPGEHSQAEDRVHRIGQTSDSINAWYLVAQGTVEEEIADLLDEKKKILGTVLDGEVVDSKSLLGELIKLHFNKE